MTRKKGRYSMTRKKGRYSMTRSKFNVYFITVNVLFGNRPDLLSKIQIFGCPCELVNF